MKILNRFIIFGLLSLSLVVIVHNLNTVSEKRRFNKALENLRLELGERYEDSLRVVLKKKLDSFALKPRPCCNYIKPSFLEGKSREEIFEMYEAFLTKFDPKNKAHQTELSRWTNDPLFLALKKDENWAGKIEELEDKIFRK